MLTKKLIICSLIILIVYAIYAGDKKENMTTVGDDISGYTMLNYDLVDYDSGHCILPTDNIITYTDTDGVQTEYYNQTDAVDACNANDDCVSINFYPVGDGKFAKDTYRLVHKDNGLCNLTQVEDDGKTGSGWYWYNKNQDIEYPILKGYTILNYFDGGYTSGHCRLPGNNIISYKDDKDEEATEYDNITDAKDACDDDPTCTGLKVISDGTVNVLLAKTLRGGCEYCYFICVNVHCALVAFEVWSQSRVCDIFMSSDRLK